MSTPELRAARSLGASALVLLGLTGPAVAQPLYQLVSRYPEFFVAHRATWADILALSASLSIVLPLLGVDVVKTTSVTTDGEPWSRRRVAASVTATSSRR